MTKQAVYNPWAHIVLAMLSTGGYRLEKTFKYLEQLRENCLTDPRQILSMDHETVARKLVASGRTSCFIKPTIKSI